MMPAEDHLRSAVAGAIAGWFGSSARLDQASYRVEPRPWSFEVRFTVVGVVSPVACIGKVPRWDEARTLQEVFSAGPQPNVAVEFATLQAIAAMVADSGDPGLAAVEPVGMIPEANLIVTRLLDAVPLRRHARRPHRGARRTGEVLRRTGRWLRRFHDEVGTARPERPPPASLAVPVPPPGTVIPGYFEVAATVRSALARLGEVPVGDLHGDVSATNVLVTREGRVALLDPNRRRGIVLEDVAHLAAELRTGRTRAISQGRVPGRRVTEARLRVLSAGYGGVEQGVLPPLVARALLQRWVDLEIRLAGSPGRNLLPLLRRHHRAEIEAALDGD